jgi:hypothetical protein
VIDLSRTAGTLTELVHGADLDQLADLAGLLEAAKVRTMVRLQPPPIAAPQKLVDSAEMARILGVPANWVRDKARAGVVPSQQLGHYVRFDPPTVLEVVRRTPGLHDSQFRGLKKRTENRGGTRRVSSECPSQNAPETDEST